MIEITRDNDTVVSIDPESDLLTMHCPDALVAFELTVDRARTIARVLTEWANEREA